jgi:hypothetical protein
MVGFICSDIMFQRQNGDPIAVYTTIRTVGREIEGYNKNPYSDVSVISNEPEIIKKFMNFRKYDVIDVKGVFDILTYEKKVDCPYCLDTYTKENGTSTFIYAIYTAKLGSVAQVADLAALDDNAGAKDTEKTPEGVISSNYREVSNQILAVGTVVSPPEDISFGKTRCCRYRIGVDRKYYIKSQSDTKADYPWVYSYGKQAESDLRHIIAADKEKGIPGTIVLVDGFYSQRKVNIKRECESCHNIYQYTDLMTQFVPYSVEYLSGYLTDEEIAEKEKLQAETPEGEE